MVVWSSVVNLLSMSIFSAPSHFHGNCSVATELDRLNKIKFKLGMEELSIHGKCLEASSS